MVEWRCTGCLSRWDIGWGNEERKWSLELKDVINGHGSHTNIHEFTALVQPGYARTVCHKPSPNARVSINFPIKSSLIVTFIQLVQIVDALLPIVKPASKIKLH